MSSIFHQYRTFIPFSCRYEAVFSGITWDNWGFYHANSGKGTKNL